MALMRQLAPAWSAEVNGRSPEGLVRRAAANRATCLVLIAADLLLGALRPSL
ncbi:MAG: hypothetical protein ABSE77_05030 [Acidimicrobiales bacterium]